MGCQRLMVLTAFLLFTKDNAVFAQYCSVVECLPQPSASIARPIVQSAAQYILPAVIQPIVAGYDSFAPDLFGYPNYGNAPAPYPALPPIIIDDGKDIMQELLYFLIFSLKNKRGNSNTPSFNGGCSCNCGCNCNNGCSCGCSNCKSNDNSNPTYIPIPFAVPVFTSSDGIPYFDSYSGYCEDNYVQRPTVQSVNERDNEICVVIRTE